MSRFIVLEGVEGSGKSTQARLLGDWLSEHGRPNVVTREPGGTPTGEALRRVLLEGGEVPARAELLLMLAARAALVEDVVRPALDAGATVIADRFDLSTLAYQAHGRGLPLEEVRRLNAFATGGLRPDVTLLLDVPLHVGEIRRTGAGRRPDRIEEAGRDFHRRVAEAYGLLAAEEPGVLRVAGDQPVGKVHLRIRETLAGLFPETFDPAVG